MTTAGLSVTVTRIVEPASGSDEFTTPNSGKHFAGVLLSITDINATDAASDDVNNDLTAVGTDGQTYTADFDSLAGVTNFDSGSLHLAKGETSNGGVAFQLPNGITIAKVKFIASSGFGNETLTWTVR